jgi:ketosteroid isomerase-like protein
MSQENVELTRQVFEIFTRQGWEPLMGTYLDPEIVWDMTPTGIPGLGTYRGFDELRSFFEDWFGAFPFEEWEQQLDEVIDCGEQIVVALTRQRAPGSTSGAVTELEYAQVVKFRRGKAVEVAIYLDRAEALEAAGLSE